MPLSSDIIQFIKCTSLLTFYLIKLAVIQFPFSMDLDKILLYVSLKAVPSFQS